MIGIIGVSQGLDDAQRNVLAPLPSVGTDILVTRVVGAPGGVGPSTTTTTTRPPPWGVGGGAAAAGGFFGGRGERMRQPQRTDVTARSHENSNVVTDLSKLGEPGPSSPTTSSCR